MTDSDKTFTRDKVARALAAFEKGSVQIRQFIQARTKGAPELAAWISEGELKAVFGEGIPLDLVFSQHDGITDIVCSHTMTTPSGHTLDRVVQRKDGTPGQIGAAMEIVRVYAMFAASVRAKSPALNAALVPIRDIRSRERDSEDECSDPEEQRLATSLGSAGYEHPAAAMRDYADRVFAGFGNFFWIVCLTWVSVDEFDAYCASMTAALQAFIDSDFRDS